MKLLLSLLVALTLFCCQFWLFQPATAQDNGPDALEVTGSIAGQVTDGAGMPLPAMAVTLYQQQSPFETISTDSTGRYRFAFLPTGIYHLQFSDPNQHLATVYHEQKAALHIADDLVVNGNDLTGIDAMMTPPGGIAGRVVISGDRASTYAYLELYEAKDGEWLSLAAKSVTVGSTNSADYTFADLPVGTYRISANTYIANGYLEEYYDNALRIENGQDITVTAGVVTTIAPIILGENPAYAAITGTIYNPLHEAQTDIVVTAYLSQTQGWTSNSSARSDEQGHYALNFLEPGLYTLRFYDGREDGGAPRYPQQYYGGVASLQSAQTFTISASSIVTGVDVTLAQGGVITGYVTIAQDHTPAHVYFAAFLKEGSREAIAYTYVEIPTAEPVAYQLSNLLAGDYIVQARGTSYSSSGSDSWSEYYQDALSFQEATAVTVTAEVTTAGIDFVLWDHPSLASIGGEVRSNQGQPLPNIEVTLFDETYFLQHQSKTANDGRYRFSGLRAGTYNLYFSDPTGVATFHSEDPTSPIPTVPTKVTVGAGAARLDVNQILTITGHITGTIIMFDGRPPKDAYAEVYRQAEGEWLYSTSLSLSDTKPETAPLDFAFGGLATGLYRLAVWTNYRQESVYAFYPGTTILEEATDIAVVDGEATTGINFVLGADTANASIAGTVLISGTPAAGIKVEIYRSDIRQLLAYVSSDEQGAYQFIGLNAGYYWLRFLDPTEQFAPIYFIAGDTESDAFTFRLENDTAMTAVTIDLAQPNHPIYLPITFWN